MIDLDKQGCQRLAQAIVKKAVQDWRGARRRLRLFPDNAVQIAILRDCEQFFLSDYFYNLTEIDGKEFLAKLKEQMRVEERHTRPSFRKRLRIEPKGD